MAGIEVRISGGEALRRVANRMRAAGQRDLAREMGRALARAAEPLETSIRGEANATMPKRGGYQGTFARSLRFRRAQHGTGNTASYRLLTYADGKKERRDIIALERGRLRHPVFGRRKSAWTVTSIHGGFHKRGTEAAAPASEKALLVVVDEYVDRMAR